MLIIFSTKKLRYEFTQLFKYDDALRFSTQPATGHTGVDVIITRKDQRLVIDVLNPLPKKALQRIMNNPKRSKKALQLLKRYQYSVIMGLPIKTSRPQRHHFKANSNRLQFYADMIEEGLGEKWELIALNEAVTTNSVYAFVHQHNQIVGLRISDHNTHNMTTTKYYLTLIYDRNHRDRLVNHLKHLVRSNAFNSFQHIFTDQAAFLLRLLYAFEKTSYNVIIRSRQLIFMASDRIYQVNYAVRTSTLNLLTNWKLIYCTDNGYHINLLGSEMITAFPLLNDNQQYKQENLTKWWLRDFLDYFAQQYSLQLIKRKPFSRFLSEDVSDYKPKQWRNIVVKYARNITFFSNRYTLLESVKPARRRSVYLTVYDSKQSRIIPIRIGVSAKERTPVDDVLTPYITLMVSRDIRQIGRQIDELFEQTKFEHYLDINNNDIVWLQKIQNINRHLGSKIKKSQDAIFVEYQHHVRATSYIFWPRAGFKQLDRLLQRRLVFLDQQGNYHISQSGGQILRVLK